MLTLIGSARNITGMVVDGFDGPIGMVEVVLIGAEPVYGHDETGTITKYLETKTLRFQAHADILRHLAGSFLEYAEQCDEAFPTPKPILSKPVAEPVATE